MYYLSDRSFKLWDYNVSHNQLLLRSPQSLDFDFNIDVVFWGVKYLDIKTHINGITIVPKPISEYNNTLIRINENESDLNVYMIESHDRCNLIAASGFKVLQNNLDIFDSSLYYFAGTDTSRNIGVVIAHS